MIKIEQRKGGFKVVGSGGGGKGGSSSRTPVESPDSLHNTSYAAILDVISNGEVVGPLHPDQPLRDIYLDGTPIQNEDGSLNFNRVETDYRVGTIDQEHIAGFPASVNVVSVGNEVTTSIPWVQQITGSELSAVRVSVNVPTLLKTLDSGDNAGDRVGYKVNYAIDLAIGGGSFENVVNASFDGKTVNGYTRTHRIDLPEGNTWRVRVRRLTPESSSTTIQDAIYVNSYAEVIDGKFRHPMTALIGLKIDAEQFQSIPTRAYHWKGRIIRVPSNYDPETRTYSGTWDGSFKNAYSNNPAWVFFDMLTNNLYGLGEYIKVTTVDRYALYQIAAYCDQMVDNGMGGLEPRFVCNCFIQSAQDAMRVINDLSSVFRGMAYYADSQVVPVADMPSDPVYTYTNANVIDGLFEYSGSDLNTRKTVALVSYNDPDNFYKSKVEVVEDSDGIARYGIRKTEVIAFGCSSRGQAQRVGLYLLYTSRMETGGVAFSVGLDGVIPQPGSIIKVADRNRAGRHIGGRIRSAEINAVVADRDHPAKVGDNLTVNLPSGKSETRAISAIDERKITVSPNFSELPASQSVWAIDADDLVTQQARVIAVQEADDITFGVSCVFHHPGKFAAIDSGVRLDPLPISVVPPRTQTAPSNIEINQFHTFHQGTTRHVAEVSWDAPENAVLYDVQWRRDNGDWIQTPRTGTRLVQIEDIFSGTYTVRVRAINSLDVPSLWATSEATVLDGEAGEPPVLSSLTTKSEVMAIRLDWSYPNTPNIISNVEIRASLNNQFQSSYALTSVAYPSTTYTVYGLGHGVEMWFWARLVDKNGLAGEWLPLSTGAGTYGKSSTDAKDILDYLAGQIGAGELAPGLVEEIQEDVASGIVGEIGGKIESNLIGYLTGDDESAPDDVLWYAGDDGSQDTFVGTRTITSAYNSLDYSKAKQIFILASRVGDNEAYIARVDATSVTRDEALAQSIVAISTTVNDNTAKILEEQTARSDADSALAQDISGLTAKVDDNAAAILNEQTARADADSALAQDISGLTAKVDDNAAAILNEQTARADADSALAQDIQTLAVQIGEAESVVQQTSEALAELDGSVKANWQVKTQVRADGKVVQAGVGLGASIGADGQVRSEFLVMADTIGFLNTVNGEIHAPFVFDTVNDTAFLNAAIIGDATISFAKIQNDIQSENYVAGETGWKINKNGDVEFSDGQFRGTVLAKKIVGDITSSITKTKQRVSVQTSLFSWVRSAAFDSVSVSIPRDWDRTMYITVNLLLKEIQGEAFAAGRARLVIVSSSGETYYSNDYKITTAEANSDKSQLSVDVGMYLPVPANATRTFTVYCEATRHASNRTFTIECSVGSTATNNVWVPLLLSNGGDLS